MKRAVSERVYNRAKDLPHSAATYDDHNRILVASWFKDRHLKVAFDPDSTGLKVIYWRAKYIILLQLTAGGAGVSSGPLVGRAALWNEPKYVAVLDQIIGDWVDKGEVNTLDVPDKRKSEHTAYIVIDKAAGLPVEPKFKDWIIHIDDASRATDE